MKIGLVDVDSHNFPNLCLMKLSEYHTRRGDRVEWWSPKGRYDLVYKSRVFTDTYSQDRQWRFIIWRPRWSVVELGAPPWLLRLIEKIEVFSAEKIDGVWEQRLRIHYNCVGGIEIPELIPLPAPEVSVNTRKGVVVNYAPSTIAG